MLLQLAVRSARLHLRHTQAVLLTMAIAFFSLVCFNSYLNDLSKYYEFIFRNQNMLGDVIIESARPAPNRTQDDPWKLMLKSEEQKWLQEFFRKREDLILSTVRFLVFDGVGVSHGPQQIVYATGYDIGPGSLMRGEPNSQAFLLSEGLMENLGCQIVKDEKVLHKNPKESRKFECSKNEFQLSTATESGHLNATEVPIQGFVDPLFFELSFRYLLMPLEFAQKLLQTEKISYVTVFLKDKSNFEKFVGELRAQNPYGLVAQSWKTHDLGQMHNQTMNFLAVFQYFVLIILLSISSLVTSTTTRRILQERSSEIGTIRSLGFGAEFVEKMIVYEIGVLSLAAVALGTLSVFVFQIFLQFVPFEYNGGLLAQPIPFRLELHWGDFVVSACVLLAVSIGTCLYVAKSFSRGPIQNLFYHKS